MKILIDMNLSPLWVSFLADQGIEAVHWSTIGEAAAPDSEILRFAAANGWIVFTHDLDFGILLATLHTNAPSVIQVRSQDVLPAAIGEVVATAIRDVEPYFETGVLVTVYPSRHRIRLLPIGENTGAVSDDRTATD